MNTTNVSDLFTENIDALPLWVKQVAYRKMENSVKSELYHFMNILNPNKLVQEIVPKITFKGKNEFEGNTIFGDIRIFVQSIVMGQNLFDIAVNNFWTLAHVCKILVKCVDLEYVEGFGADPNYAIAQFLSGQIRTGELLKRLGQLDVLQLRQALEEQRAQKEMGNDIKIADVMIQLGFITEADAKILLNFKEDAEKPLIMGFGFTTIKFDETNNKHKELIMNLQREFKNIVQENKVLKERLRTVLNIK